MSATDRDDEVWRLPKAVAGEDLGLGRRARPSPAAKARLRRIVDRTPEVMVKITGRTRRGAPHLKAHLDYITRNGRLTAERDDGTLVASRHELRDLHHHWVRSNGVFARNPEGAHSVNIILSMQPGTPPDRVEAASRRWARETFADRHDWLMVRHDDSQHPHVHVTVRAVGSDGRRLAPGPEQLQQWRERFARELRRLGVPAEATPRQARGIVVRPASTPVHRIAQRGAVSAVSARLLREARSDVESQVLPTVAYWSQTIQRRQASIRAAYLQHAEVLMDGDRDEQRLGRDIQRFVAALPVPLPRRQALAVALSVAERRREAGTRPSPDIAAERIAPASPQRWATPPAPKPTPR